MAHNLGKISEEMKRACFEEISRYHLFKFQYHSEIIVLNSESMAAFIYLVYWDLEETRVPGGNHRPTVSTDGCFYLLVFSARISIITHQVAVPIVWWEIVKGDNIAAGRGHHHTDHLKVRPMILERLNINTATGHLQWGQNKLNWSHVFLLILEIYGLWACKPDYQINMALLGSLYCHQAALPPEVNLLVGGPMNGARLTKLWLLTISLNCIEMNRRLLVNNDFILHSLLGKLTISLITLGRLSLSLGVTEPKSSSSLWESEVIVLVTSARLVDSQ